MAGASGVLAKPALQSLYQCDFTADYCMELYTRLHVSTQHCTMTSEIVSPVKVWQAATAQNMQPKEVAYDQGIGLALSCAELRLELCVGCIDFCDQIQVLWGGLETQIILGTAGAHNLGRNQQSDLQY